MLEILSGRVRPDRNLQRSSEFAAFVETLGPYEAGEDDLDLFPFATISTRAKFRFLPNTRSHVRRRDDGLRARSRPSGGLAA